jgi:cyclic pyranopterin phosphate synthase
MPRDVFGPGFQFLPHAEVLTFEEITRLVRSFVTLGVRKLRLTGGEPLVRRDLPLLVAQLAAVEGVEDLTLTTNGSLLAGRARPLADAGLRRITVSLDSLDDEVFRRMTDVEVPVATILAGIEAAQAAGLAPVKVNMVVRRDINQASILPMARECRDRGLVLRFIEYMDVGTTNGWRLDDVVPADEIVATIDAQLPLEPLPPEVPGEVAARYRYRDGGGEIGVISSVTQPFCGTCTRARLTAEGRLYTCLFAADGTDLRGPLRGGEDDAAITARIAAVWAIRADRYSELRSDATRDLPRVEMSHIGG